MAYLSKHTWYTTFRRQPVSFCFVLFCPRFWLGGVGAIAREAPSEKHGAPHAALRGLAASEAGLRQDDRAGVSRRWRQISTKFCSEGHRIERKGPGPVGAQAGICPVVSSNDPGLD